MKTAPSNFDDIIDSRDIIERIKELKAHRAGYERSEDNSFRDWRDECEDEATELAVLLALQEAAEGYSEDWRDGAALIRDSYFKTYAQELADDIGALKDTDSWPMRCIDWEQAARELQQDYTSVEFDGVTYWVR